MRPNRIVCVGNRFVAGDDFGPRVHSRLTQRPLPDGVEVIDGGIAGLNLLRHLEGAGRVVLVDTLDGRAGPGEVAVLTPSQVSVEPPNGSARWAPLSSEHSHGLQWMLRALPEVCEGDPPEVLLVCAEAGSDEDTVAKASELALELVIAGSEAASIHDVPERGAGTGGRSGPEREGRG